MRHLPLFGLLATVLYAASAPASSMPKNSEASVLVTGNVQVAADGSVTGHTIDSANQLDAGIVRVIDTSMVDWRFKPMQGPASASMRLVLHARKQDGGNYLIWISSATFQSPQEKTVWSYSAASEHMHPKYPQEALENAVGGTAYLAVHVNQDGKVIDAIAEQVNVSAHDNPKRMEHWRAQLGDAAIAAARGWHFSRPSDSTAPSEGETEAARTLHIPVSYSVGTGVPKYGQWEIYVPGPQHPIPWLAGGVGSETSPDALASGGIYPVEHGGLQLVTKLAAN